ncbi:hypothetical protein [Kibdelosporangium phytohabitans]|uniref:Uncharacterized protein n=1 Tax=Kibdelosporangium phytohabitans TaxID=860235 RepID=A0A0N9HVM3_9PSEU|nr:hypothetical protein [Kibdelosporangium phytohabitans]ALG07603.1 hypothetical protein AOZ06_12415 [Kibdelosporangium phytohabitans]MBE1471449.1 hypothetical protein [Kibdelosporangium phytohabitans]
MRTLRRELARIWACVTDRPRWQLVMACVVSVWSLAWVVGQAIAPPMAPSEVPRALLAWAGVPVGWLDAVGQWAREDSRWWVFTVFAVAAGLLWAATTERAQLTALAGWLAVMAAAEGIGYHPAVYRAIIAMAGFILLLWLLSLPGKVSVMTNRITLVPRDVLRAGATAAAMAAMVPLLAVGLIVIRLLRPYVTRPPKVVVPRAREAQENPKTLVRD